MAAVSLHIGAPKTATSYIQAWLFANRGALLQAGVYAPGRPIHAHRLAVEHLTGPDWDRRADVVEIRRTPLDAALQDFRRGLQSETMAAVILSSEYYYHADPAAVCAATKERFGAIPQVVVYIRAQVELALSGHNQDIKRMGKTGSRPRPKYHQRYDWGHLLDSWAKHFGKDRLKIVSFDQSARQGTILNDFIEAACPMIGRAFAEGAFPNPQFLNESLPADLLELKRLANMWGEFGLHELLEEILRSGYAGPRFGVSAEEADEWQALYAESNAYVAREYFGGTPVEVIFPYAHSKPGVDLEGKLPAETVVKVFALAMKRQEERRTTNERRLSALEQQLAELVQKLRPR